MEKIAEINHGILVKLPLGVQSLLKSLPFPDFSLLFLGLSFVVIIIILIMNIYSQVETEIHLQETLDHHPLVEADTKEKKIIQHRKKRANRRRNNAHIKENIASIGLETKMNENNEGRKISELKISKKKQN